MDATDYVFAARGLATSAGFLWFLKSSVQNAVVWVPLSALLVALFIAYRRSEPFDRRRYFLLLIPPALWIFIGLWGSFFWIDVQKKPFVPNPEWVHQVIVVNLLAFLLSGIGLIIYLRGARVFATIYLIINLFFVLAMSFLASMAITGTWL